MAIVFILYTISTLPVSEFKNININISETAAQPEVALLRLDRQKIVPTQRESELIPLNIPNTTSAASASIDSTFSLDTQKMDAQGSIPPKNACTFQDRKIARQGGLAPNIDNFALNTRTPPSLEENSSGATKRNTAYLFGRQDGWSALRWLTNRNKNLEQEQTKYPVVQQAQGWTIAPDGKIVLTATATNITPQSPALTYPRCAARSEN